MAPIGVIRSVSGILRQPKFHAHLTRGMIRPISSGSGPASRQFLVQVSDLPDSQEKRSKTKQAHIEECTPLIESGKLSYFGVTLSEHPTENGLLEINGSVMVLEAESETIVRNFLRRDAYSRAGVWDVEKAKIWLFKSG